MTDIEEARGTSLNIAPITLPLLKLWRGVSDPLTSPATVAPPRAYCGTPLEDRRSSASTVTQ